MNRAQPLKDRRNFPRISKETSIEVEELSYPLPREPGEDGVSKNIGAGGVCFTTAASYNPGTLLSIKINLLGWQRYKNSFTRTLDISSSREPLSGIGRVVWCQELEDEGGYEIGLEFVDIYEDDYKALMKYLEGVTSLCTVQ